MNYRWRLVTLYRRQESRPCPRERNAKRSNGCLRRHYKQLRKEEKLKAKEKRKGKPIEHRAPKNSKENKKAFLSAQCKAIEENY